MTRRLEFRKDRVTKIELCPDIRGGTMPNLRSFFSNMSVEMPLHRKLYLVLRNWGIKIIKRQNCCGHPGEPGCCE